MLFECFEHSVFKELVICTFKTTYHFKNKELALMSLCQCKYSIQRESEQKGFNVVLVETLVCVLHSTVRL